MMCKSFRDTPYETAGNSSVRNHGLGCFVINGKRGYMKNRRPVGNREIILLYHFRGTEIGQQLHVVAARMGILCKVIEEEQTDETLGALLKLPGFRERNAEEGTEKTTEEILAKTMEVFGEKKSEPVQASAQEKKELTRQAMVMHGFTQKRLDEFLKSMRRAGLPVIPLKAIVTPYNVNWTFRALYEELEREEEAFLQQKAEDKRE